MYFVFVLVLTGFVFLLFCSSTVMSILSWTLPLAFIYFLMKRAGSAMGGMGGRPGSGGAGGMFGFSQSKARIIKENTGVTFKYGS